MTTADPIHDQALAAFNEAERLVKSLPGDRVRCTPIMNRVLFRWIGEENTWHSCGHIDNPELCFGLGDLPALLMCANCWITNSELAKNECDWCRTSPQTDKRVVLHPTAYPIGPAIVIILFCDRHIIQPGCGAHEAATQSPHT